MAGMLAPYTVLDFTDERGEIGPMLLGDLGADVIRVEPPGGVSARRANPLIPEGGADSNRSLQFLAFNRNKRSIVLDPASAADREVLNRLIRKADFIFESARPSFLGGFGITFDVARELNPDIVFTRLTPFGDTGPWADLVASDLVIAALGGPIALQGQPDRAPVRLSVPQVWRHAGVEAAAGAMVAHRRVLAGSGAQFVDLSAHAAMTWTMLNAMDAHAIQGFDFERGSDVARLEILHPVQDGWIVAIPHSKVMRPMTARLIEEGVAEPWLRDVDWLHYDQNIADPEQKPLNLATSVRMLRTVFMRYPRQHWFEYGLKHRITFAPVNSLQELLAFDHLQFREYWRRQPVGNKAVVRFPGLWLKSPQTPLVVNCEVPVLDRDGAQIRAEAAATPWREPKRSGAAATSLPFEGIRVADFAWVGVGPISSKFLADHGATVVRVESENRPDVLRANGPFKDGVAGWNRSQFFGDFNTSKQSLALDLKSDRAIAIARKLIAGSDVFIESFAPGAVARMGLGYDEVSKLNPGIIMLSTCLMGQTGPAAPMAGYGYHAAAIAGFYEVTGWADRHPTGPWVAYTDVIAPRFVSILLAAALDHRRRTGQGCYLDVAQIETALHFLGPELLDLEVNGFAARRNGNRARFTAPEGVYPCSVKDTWCAIAVLNEVQWQSLCRTIGRDDWLQDAMLASVGGRQAAHDRIDAGIAAWTSQRTSREVMDSLQAAGVSAGVVQRSSELLQDPQHAHRGFYRWFDHPEMGHIPYAGHQFRILGYDNGPRAPAPCLGEHSYEVLTEIIGLDGDAVAAAYEEGLIV
jgi:crotonobetainyl-CoA:carnitine CoA-transferase CaiB-like acyl-CoA transferase